MPYNVSLQSMILLEVMGCCWVVAAWLAIEGVETEASSQLGTT